jgi:predicted phage terminase large subunit-like protein
LELTADIISGFSASVLQKNYDNPVESPTCHYDWWALCTSKHPKVAIAAPRRHAKSTAITLAYVLASVLFRDKEYVLIVSDTITQAIQFLGDVKKELYDNEKIRSLFNIQEFVKDSEETVIVKMTDGHLFRITAKGSEQTLRGLKWDHKRPDLIVGDDLENDEIVLNSQRRTKFKRWFYGALVPSLSQDGVIRIVGTILHEDSLLNNLMPSLWDRNTVAEPLKVYSKLVRPSWKAVKYRAHTDDFKHILWPANYNADWFLEQRQDFIDRGLSDVYSQEYLNEPIDDSVAYFKKTDFIAMSNSDQDKRLHHYIAVDLAISEKETADYSVFVVAGVDQDKGLHIKNVIRERLDGREIVDMLIQLQRVYEPELVGIEEMQVSKAIGPFLREEMMKTGVYLNLAVLKHGGKDKIARARSIQGRMRARAVKFDKTGDWYPTFEDELCKFPRGRNDDQVDAFAYIGMMLDSLVEAPTQQEIDEEEYEYELHTSGNTDSGRSAFTGY